MALKNKIKLDNWLFHSEAQSAMNKTGMLFSILYIMIFHAYGQNQLSNDWTHYARVAGHSLNSRNINSIVQSATESNVFGIEVDNDITGRYESFLNPEKKLEDIRQVSKNAHAVGNHTFVYIAGLECITDDADNLDYSFYKDYPEWVQRDKNGRPAVFGGGDAFWIGQGDEDVWISPYASDWRKKYMQHVRDIAANNVAYDDL